LSLSYVQDHVLYKGGNFTVFSRGSLGLHINCIKPVYYNIIYAYPDASGSYDIRTEPIHDHNLHKIEDAKSITGREPLYKNMNSTSFSFGVNGNVAIGMEITVNKYFGTGILAGGQAVAN